MEITFDWNKLSEEIKDKVLNYLDINPQLEYLDLVGKFFDIFDKLDIQTDTKELKNIIFETYKEYKESQSIQRAQQKYQDFIKWLSDYSC